MKILHFADLHLGVESYGRIDPESGLSTRFLDFLKSLDRLVDYALENRVDIVIFCGDAYKSREPSQTQQREFARRIHRLATGGIPIFLLIGNHDLPNAIGKATTTEIFDTLAVANVYVANRPAIYHIPTPSGALQIVSLPWPRRSALLAQEDNKNLNLNELNQKLQAIITGTISENAAKLDPKLPAVLAAHVWVSGAKIGSEESMVIGQEHTLLISNVAHSAFDYVALGHIHHHQVLAKAAPVVYAGSLARLDFGDEDDEKGFYLVEIETDRETGTRSTSFSFQPIETRRFLTINVNIKPEDTAPTETVLQAITEKQELVPEAIIRLLVSLPAELGGQLRDNDLREALREAHYFTIAKDIQRETRLRLGNLAAEEITPLDALKKYLEVKNTPPERANLLLGYSEKLMRGEVEPPEKQMPLL